MLIRVIYTIVYELVWIIIIVIFYWAARGGKEHGIIETNWNNDKSKTRAVIVSPDRDISNVSNARKRFPRRVFAVFDNVSNADSADFGFFRA